MNLNKQLQEKIIKMQNELSASKKSNRNIVSD